jgi:tRNA(Arg) A34 adenosine deaminase TadA
MWSELSIPWCACLELAWEAYHDDCKPIGAVITDKNGNILAKGRNRIYAGRKPEKHIRGYPLAHAEMDALQALDYDAQDPHDCILYTTTEPCPLCMGAFYMSGLRTLHYASRDPFAGSANMLGKTWYLARKAIKVFEPQDQILEIVIMALHVEYDYYIETLHGHPERLEFFYKRWAEVVPRGVGLGMSLVNSGKLRQMLQEEVPVSVVFDQLVSLVE